MHAKLIEEATYEQLKSFLYAQFDELKRTMPEIYRDMECELYEHVHGPHFTKWKYDCAVAKLQNEDGTVGPHWPLEDIMAVAKSKGVTFDRFNEYDFAYAMNMLYSDFSVALNGSVDSIVKMTRAFLDDKDAPEGKAFLYWKAMKKGG